MKLVVHNTLPHTAKLKPLSDSYISIGNVYVFDGFLIFNPQDRAEAEAFIEVHNFLSDSPLMKALE